MKHPETGDIVKTVTKFVNLMSQHVSKALHVEIIPVLSGSFAESTKCFAPDEFDFTLDCHTRLEEKNLTELPLKVYACIDTIIRSNTMSLQ